MRANGSGLRLLGAALALVVAGTGAGVASYRARHVSSPLLTMAVGIGADGALVDLPPDAGSLHLAVPGTRVLKDAPGAPARAAAQRAWLASGTVPGASVDDARLRTLVATALLDLDTLTQPDGASVAGGPGPWRYVWPRDAAFAAVAFAVAGHPDDARRVLEFVQDLPAPDGVFQARYRTDGSGPPDARGEQTDGTGWTLWAVARVAATLDRAGRADLLDGLAPLVRRTTAAVLRLTAGPGALPHASPDYWEVRDGRLSLGTAAPLALGLEAAAGLTASAAERAALTTRAARLRASITDRFGAAGYPRYLGGDERDAGLAFLLPPFTASADPAVPAAWRAARTAMRRPAGGLAPGAGWKQDGISWTPETALFALTAAAAGDRSGALAELRWLAAHRTAAGALPEKVLSDGSAAGPAPLGWTDALVVLIAHQLDV